MKNVLNEIIPESVLYPERQTICPERDIDLQLLDDGSYFHRPIPGDSCCFDGMKLERKSWKRIFDFLVFRTEKIKEKMRIPNMIVCAACDGFWIKKSNSEVWEHEPGKPCSFHNEKLNYSSLKILNAKCMEVWVTIFERKALERKQEIN